MIESKADYDPDAHQEPVTVRWADGTYLTVPEDNPHSCIYTEGVAHRCLACEAQWIVAPDAPAADATPAELTLRERLANIVVGLDDRVADGCDIEGLLATPDAGIAAEPFLSVESGDSGLWLTMWPTVADAAEANYQQECAGDWNLDVIIDVRDGSRWGATPTWTAFPMTDNIVTVPPNPEEPA